MELRAVVFDWMMTLVHYPSRAEHLRLALDRIGRPEPDGFVDAMTARLAEPYDDDVAQATSVLDTSAQAHHFGEHLHWERCAIDDELAASMYDLLADPSFYEPYPDAGDVMGQLRDAGLTVAVISDIHTDLRQHAARYGWSDLIDAWVLSFEHGIEKPDPRLFQLALDELGVEPHEALVVGDNPARDQGGVELGMPTLLLPRRADVGDHGLDAVLALACR